MGEIALPISCLDDLQDDRLRRLRDHWREKCAGMPMPPKEAIDPVDFPYILGYVSMVVVENAPMENAQAAVPRRRYFFRLDGSILARLSGVDYTGKYFDELGMPQDYVDFINAGYDLVVDSGKPYAYRKTSDYGQKIFDEETMILPLGKDGAVHFLLVAVIPGDLPPQTEKRVI
jgi:hypothetical protein